MRSMAEDREVMDVRQASQYLGVSRETLYKYLTHETIPAFKLGNRWKFKKAVLDRWMEEESSQHREARPQRKRSSARV
jgi:excisionase family DNA binding protein